MLDRIAAKSQNDRSGSVVLEELLRQEDDMLLVHSKVDFKEVLLTGCWYLWWDTASVEMANVCLGNC